MSDTVVAQTKAEPRRSGSTDQNALALIERWLAVIRELVREQTKPMS